MTLLDKETLPGLLSLQGGPDQAPMNNDYLANKRQYLGATELTRAPGYWILG